jgi:hypothetical protein
MFRNPLNFIQAENIESMWKEMADEKWSGLVQMFRLPTRQAAH